MGHVDFCENFLCEFCRNRVAICGDENCNFCNPQKTLCEFCYFCLDDDPACSWSPSQEQWDVQWLEPEPPEPAVLKNSTESTEYPPSPAP